MAQRKITGNSIESGAIGADQIATGAVTVEDVADGSLTASKLHTDVQNTLADVANKADSSSVPTDISQLADNTQLYYNRTEVESKIVELAPAPDLTSLAPASFVLPASSTAPSNPVVGQSYYNTSNNTSYVWNGQAWKKDTIAATYQPYALDFFGDSSGISLLRFDNSIGDDGGANTFNSGGSYSTGATNSTGQCIDFGSSNNGSYVGIDGRGPRSAAAGGFSWSFWMYYYGSTFNDHGFFGTNSSSSEGHLFHFHATSSQFYVIQSGGSSINNIPVANPQSWNHFCSTFGEDGKMKVYLNGVLQGEQTCTTNFPSSYSSQTLFVGRDRCCEDTMRYTNGAFDHVRIFSRPLNATEVQALYEEFTL